MVLVTLFSKTYRLRNDNESFFGTHFFLNKKEDDERESVSVLAIAVLQWQERQVNISILVIHHPKWLIFGLKGSETNRTIAGDVLKAPIPITKAALIGVDQVLLSWYQSRY